MNRCQPFVDKLPIELTVLLVRFKKSCNFNNLPGTNEVDSLVSTNLTEMMRGIEENFLDQRQEIHGVGHSHSTLEISNLTVPPPVISQGSRHCT